MNEQEKYQMYCKSFETLCKMAIENGWGDPASYARSKEIYMAAKLGHTIAPKLAGPDAYDKAGSPLEYKSTTQDRIQGAYNGVSVQSTWKEQEKYLKQDKIGCYKEHYFARFKDGLIAECYMLTGKQVLENLLPKYEKAWHKLQKKMPKDPRLGASVPSGYIKKNGVKVI